MNLLLDIQKKAKKAPRTIVLPEGTDERIVRAAEKIVKEKIANIILIGNKSNMQKLVKGVDLGQVKIIDPKDIDTIKYADKLFELRAKKGMTKEKAAELAKNPMYLGVLMVKMGEADGLVAGAAHSTSDVLRPALQIIKTGEGINTVSSCFIMVMPDGSKYGQDGVLVFGDCAVVVSPTASQLADIALASCDTAKEIAGIKSPKVALLSFSTKASASHPYVDKVLDACKLVKKIDSKLQIDGDLQLDAAIEKKVACLKAPKSEVAGNANILIFPDLQSGNIGYKLVERLAGAKAIGPICQGFKKPVNDLSRGCSVDDIVNVVAITVLQAGR